MLAKLQYWYFRFQENPSEMRKLLCPMAPSVVMIYGSPSTMQYIPLFQIPPAILHLISFPVMLLHIDFWDRRASHRPLRCTRVGKTAALLSVGLESCVSLVIIGKSAWSPWPRFHIIMLLFHHKLLVLRGVFCRYDVVLRHR